MQKINLLTGYPPLRLLKTQITAASFPDIESIYICDSTPMPLLQPCSAYLGTWEAALPLLEQVTDSYPVLFLIAGAPKLSCAQLGRYPCNILLSDQDIFSLYNILNDTLLAWNRWSSRFATLGQQKNSLQALIEAGASMLQTSLILVNAGYSLICYRLRDDPDILLASFPGLNALFTKGFLSLQTILQMKEESGILILPVKQGADTLAYLLMPELTSEDYAAHTFAGLLLSALRQHLAVQRQSYSGHYKVEFEQLIRDLIDMNTISEEEVQNRLDLMEAQTKHFYCCLVIVLAGTDAATHPFNSMIGGLGKIFPSGYFAIYQDHIVAMLPVAERRFPDYDRKEFLRLLHNFQAFAGLSGPLSRLEQFRTVYLMASSAIRLGRALGTPDADPVYLYNDYRIYHMIDMCREGFINRYHHDNLAYLCHPMVISLYAHDRDHQTDFVEILSTYLRADCNLTKTARILNFHRNTMLYKLSKIEAIIGDTLTDSNLKQTLLLSCYTIRYITDYLKDDVFQYTPIQKETEGSPE